jgi:hypothetical protein
MATRRASADSVDTTKLTLGERLVHIQNELKAPKSQYNSFGKYAYRNQEDILEALKPLLFSYGVTMTISDSIHEVFGLVYVEAQVRVSAGDDEIAVTAQAGIDPNRKGMDIAQSFGSSSSYARKYALNAMFLIDDTKDADATNTHGKGAVKTPAPVAAPVAPAQDDLFQRAVSSMNSIGTQEQYEKIIASAGDKFTESQKNALSKLIK